MGRGGITAVFKVSGLARSTIARGLKELGSERASADPSRIRCFGAGRKSLVEKDSRLWKDLESLVEPGTRGDPESPLRWTSKSLRLLAGQLWRMGHTISYRAVGHLLKKAGYSLQANQKMREGKQHPDRNAQFEYINQRVIRQRRAGQPVISGGHEEKGVGGEFQEYRPGMASQGRCRRVRVHDFIIPEKGKAIPYGVYDLARNEGWVNVGIDHDTAAFAVQSIRRWWRTMGRPVYRSSRSLLIMADSGGSNGSRARLWKWELQRLAAETGLSISVCHFPPGTSKWNKIEHRLFSFISRNWRGRPLESLAVIVQLIGSTRTNGGLKVRCEMDMGRYPQGQKITDEQMATLHLKPEIFHGDWNYTIRPSKRKKSTR